jgi:hypothetical protein
LTSQPTSPFSAPQWLSITVFLSAGLVYLATLTSDHYWDGITFALQIEKVAKAEARVALLFHQNHLLYNAFGYIAHRATDFFEFDIRALYLLQCANVAIGAGSVLIFFRMAARATRNTYVALVCTGFLAFSAAWWKISTDANAYIVTILLILVVASNILGEKPRWFVAGLALAGAMLFHELASLFYPAALAAVFSSKTIDTKARFAASMSALAGAVTILGYYSCAYLLNGLTNPIDVLKWAASNPSLKPVSSNPVEAILLFPKINVDAILGHNFGLFRQQGEWIEITIALASVVVFVVFAFTAARKVDVVGAARTLREFAPEMTQARKQIGLMVIVWIGTYALFLLFWGPLIYFRAFYAPAIGLGLGLALANYHTVTSSKPSRAAALAVVAFVLFNLAFYIAPNMRANANTRVAEARKARRVWNEQTVVFFGARTESDTTFEYFNPSTEWRKLLRVSLTELESEIARAYNQGGSVWLNTSAALLVDADWLAGHSSDEKIEFDSPNMREQYVRVSPDR